MKCDNDKILNEELDGLKGGIEGSIENTIFHELSIKQVGVLKLIKENPSITIDEIARICLYIFLILILFFVIVIK